MKPGHLGDVLAKLRIGQELPGFPMNEKAQIGAIRRGRQQRLREMSTQLERAEYERDFGCRVSGI